MKVGYEELLKPLQIVSSVKGSVGCGRDFIVFRIEFGISTDSIL